MVTRPLALAVLVAAVASLGCGAPPIERLRGEPKAAQPYTVAAKPTPPVADAVNRFIAAARRGATEEAFERLSRSTRFALEARARTVGLRGVDLLRKPGPTVAGAARKLYVGDLIATFALRELAKIRVGERPWPANKPHDGRTLSWRVQLVNRSGATRTIQLRFEGVAWRIHNPALTGGPDQKTGKKVGARGDARGDGARAGSEGA